MKSSNIFWGIVLILIAVILVLDALGIIAPLVSAVGEIPVFAIVAGILLLSYAVSRLVKGKLSEIFLPLAVLIMIFEKNIAALLGREDPNIISNWLLLLCALLLTAGFSILLPSQRDKANAKWNGKTAGSSTVYIDCSDFVSECVENNMGSCVVRFENADRYTGGGVLNIENNMGSMVIHVPSAWKINAKIESNLCKTTLPGTGNPEGPVLTITGENNMGSVLVQYV